MRDIQSSASSTAPTLTIQEMNVALSVLGGVKAIDIMGATLELKEKEAVSFLKERWQAFGKALKDIKHLTLPILTLHDCLLIVPGPQGPFKIPVQAISETTVTRSQVVTVDWGEPGERKFSGQFILELGQKGITVDIHAAHIDIKMPSVHLKAPELSLWGTTASEEEGGHKIEGFAKIDHLALAAYGTLKMPLEVNLEGAGTENDFSLDEFTIVPQASNASLLEAEGTIKLDQPSIEMVLTSEIPQLSKVWDFTPLLAAYAGDKVRVEGVLDVAGKIHWQEGKFNSSGLVVDVKGASLARDGFSVEGATFTLTFSGLHPLVTKGAQRLTATQLSFGKIGLKNILLEAFLDDTGSLQIHQFTGEVLRGTLKAHRFQRISEPSLTYQFEADFKNIELADILKLTDLKNLAGHAKLAGSALMSYGWEDGLDVVQAELHSISDAGLIQYKPGEATFSQQKEVNMAFQVLDDLNFTLFNVRLGRAPNNPLELQAIVKILGSNPKVLNGYPFEFNIVTTGKLKDLVVNTLEHMGPYKDLNKLNQAIKETKDAKVAQKAAKISKLPEKRVKAVKAAKVVKVEKTARRAKRTKLIKVAKRPKPMNRKLKDG